MTIKIVVPVSGGKDSQACLKLALQSYPANEVMGLFCDTQFEHPLTYEHIDTMRAMYGVHIERITAGSVPEKVRKYQRFPGGGARFCTEELKIVPSKKFYKELAERQGSILNPQPSYDQESRRASGGFEVWYGMRSGESSERERRYRDKINTEIYAPHEVMSKYPKYLQKLGVMFRLPVIDFETNDIFEILDGEHNPLYDEGFDRVGCFPCLASGDKWKEKAFSHDKFGVSQRVIVMKLSKEIGKSAFTSIGGNNRNNEKQRDLFDGCAICQM